MDTYFFVFMLVEKNQGKKLPKSVQGKLYPGLGHWMLTVDLFLFWIIFFIKLKADISVFDGVVLEFSMHYI